MQINTIQASDKTGRAFQDAGHKNGALLDALTTSKVIDRHIDARVACALYSDTGHSDRRKNTRARLPFDSEYGNGCRVGDYFISAFSGLSLREAPAFTGDRLLRDMAVACLLVQS